jgi:DNA-binding IclR family transcriptional regulator
VLEVNRSQLQPYELLYRQTLRQLAEDAQARGFALMPVNVLPYVSGVAVAIPAAAGSPHSALSVSALSARLMDNERYMDVVRLLEEEAQAIAAACR